MKNRKLRTFAATGAAVGAVLLLSTAAFAEDITFAADQGQGDLMKVKVRNVATVTVDSVAISQHAHGSCVDQTRRHKKNLAGKAGKVGKGGDFVAYLWSGCDYGIKFSTATACQKGDKDIVIRPEDFQPDLIVKLTGNCTDGLKPVLGTYIPNADDPAP
ncbi:MAG: hypothetical protein GC201_09930 [Alphaproteobacteria bacterium]|nr:hypothetical protein [Alphaproteobacteria bacterium]